MFFVRVLSHGADVIGPLACDLAAEIYDLHFILKMQFLSKSKPKAFISF
jgi:hypothetical protein